MTAILDALARALLDLSSNVPWACSHYFRACGEVDSGCSPRSGTRRFAGTASGLRQ